MRSPRQQRPIPPKISTMPRPQTAAATYLDLYKLVTEQQRLEQELATLEQRRDRIQTRLAELELHIGTLANAAQQPQANHSTGRTTQFQPSAPTEKFSTVFLEY